uniref:G-protein coupled receptors family 1 profile domain-containing protein n=1 Tax=Ditylenchus dipsaci TaxID=166011 RepID=A0A915DEF2_9BILA
MSSLLTAPINNCSAAYIYAKSTPSFLVHSLHCLSALLAIVLFISCLRILTDRRKKFFTFHTNLKVIFLGGSFFYVNYAIFNFAGNFRDVIFYLVPLNDPCDYTTIGWMCMILKIPPIMCIIGFTFFHAAVSIDRIYASFYANAYEKRSAKAGILAVFIMMSLTMLYTFYIFCNEDFSIVKSKCSPNTANTSDKLRFMDNFLLSIDILVTFSEFYLRYYINRLNRTSLVVFATGKTLICFPNSLSYGLFAELTTLIVNFYIVATLTTFLYLIKKVEKARSVKLIKLSQSADVYFQQFHKQIQ